MKHLVLPILILAASPALAQDEPRSLMQRGAEMFLEGLRGEMAPALDDLGALADQFGPAMRDFLQEMGPAMADLFGQVQDWSVYHPPEILPNGDILIRRKEPQATPEAAEPDAPIDL